MPGRWYSLVPVLALLLVGCQPVASQGRSTLFRITAHQRISLMLLFVGDPSVSTCTKNADIRTLIGVILVYESLCTPCGSLFSITALSNLY